MPNFQTAIITHIKQQLKTEKKVEQVLWICGNIIMKFSRQEKPANDTEIHVINVDELGSQIPKPKFKKSLFSFSPVFRLVLCFPLWTLNRKSECFHEFLRSDLSINWAAGVYIVPVVACLNFHPFWVILSHEKPEGRNEDEGCIVFVCDIENWAKLWFTCNKLFFVNISSFSQTNFIKRRFLKLSRKEVKWESS